MGRFEEFFALIAAADSPIINRPSIGDAIYLGPSLVLINERTGAPDFKHDQDLRDTCVITTAPATPRAPMSRSTGWWNSSARRGWQDKSRDPSSRRKVESVWLYHQDDAPGSRAIPFIASPRLLFISLGGSRYEGRSFRRSTCAIAPASASNCFSRRKIWCST